MQLQSSKRIDIIWDTYLPDSLKESTREKRGKGLRRKVSSQAKLPGKWMDFLCDFKNKTELFAFLTDQISKFTFPPNKQVYVSTLLEERLREDHRLKQIEQSVLNTDSIE